MHTLIVWITLALGSSARQIDKYVSILLESTPGENLVSSPIGLWSLMNCLALGARGNSLKQITDTFRLAGSDERVASNYKLVKKSLFAAKDFIDVACFNYIFYDGKIFIDDEYVKSVKEMSASVKSLNFTDFKAMEHANKEVKRRQNVDVKILEEGDFKRSGIILANIVYFKGSWGSAFDSKLTTKENFYDNERNVLGKVKMMNQLNSFSVIKVPELNTMVIELPFGVNEQYCMLIFLPDNSTTVYKVAQRLSRTNLRPIFQQLDMTGEAATHVKIPRFKIESTLDLTKRMHRMGVTDIFNLTADFRKMAPDGDCHVTKVTQQAIIEVTESGAVAKPNTKKTNRKFVANRPFIYFVVARPSEVVLFEGIYEVPRLF